ncbi:MAG: pre-peptidase C-terminal domain-containing protein [Chitinophagales bacterium]|nr:pre-peptidase C-terminal domain-containing protein [Chitinophagales bacterium]
MKTNKLLAIVLCSLLWFTAAGTETEPNDTKSKANKLALNGNNTGAVTPGGDVDWWKISTNADGMISLTLTSTNGVYLSYQLYDNNGTTGLNYIVNYVNGTTAQNTDGLAQGTYYVKVYATNIGEQPSYTISDLLTVPSQSNDLEPNGSSVQAITLAQNSTLNGHVGYYFNAKRDTADWYKVTTNSDGQLSLTLSSGNAHYLSLFLYDKNGTTVLNGFNYDNSTQTLNTNGLAAGTYYFRIYCTNPDDFAPYIIKDTLITPTVANDIEPNNSPSAALSINIGETKTGHAGYYYNVARDTMDWYKVTTAADGQLNLTLASVNNQYLSLFLFDNNGTKQLNGFNYNNSTQTLTTNGLAAGTYYFKVYCTDYNSAFAPYTINAALVSATGANDAEPNGSKTNAVTLPQGGSLTGHVGYYFNLTRDTADWYSITTAEDGKLDITLLNTGGSYLSVILYDNNGATPIQVVNYWLNSNTLVTDGLKAGTYIVKVYCTNYNGEFTTYTISNTLSTYAYAADAEPNNYAAQARTMPSYGTVTGHINFYYDGQYDQPDWWKINYTGSGFLRIRMTEANGLACNCQRYFTIAIYKDTAAAAIYYNYYQTGTLTVDLNGLTPAYYYIKIFSTGTNEFFTYSLTDSFTQVNCNTTITANPDIGSNCNNSSITYQCDGGNGPYMVQLYRFGLPFNIPALTNGSGAVTFSNLTSGLYTATAFADGATGSCFGASKESEIGPGPKNTATANITASSAQFTWNTLPCAKYYTVRYRLKDTPPWTKKKTNGNIGSMTVNNLTAGKTYEWQVAMVDTANDDKSTGKYSKKLSFTTSARMSELNSMSAKSDAVLYPNPVSEILHISFNNEHQGSVSIRLLDMQSRLIYSLTKTCSSGMNMEEVDLHAVASGVYTVQIIMPGRMMTSLPMIKE